MHDARFTWILGVVIPWKTVPPRAAIVPDFHSVLVICPTQLFFICENGMLLQIVFVIHVILLMKSLLTSRTCICAHQKHIIFPVKRTCPVRTFAVNLDVRYSDATCDFAIPKNSWLVINELGTSRGHCLHSQTWRFSLRLFLCVTLHVATSCSHRTCCFAYSKKQLDGHIQSQFLRPRTPLPPRPQALSPFFGHLPKGCEETVYSAIFPGLNVGG